jgi:hypothetical protein
MITSKNVHRKGGLIIYHLHDDEDEDVDDGVISDESQIPHEIGYDSNTHDAVHDMNDTSHFNIHSNHTISDPSEVNFNVEKSFDDMLDSNRINSNQTHKQQITIVLDGANIGENFLIQ